jgi:hypothetical protein
MEWREFLEKTEPTGLTDRQKILLREIETGDHEDHKNLFAKKLEPKEASWESWLDKNEKWDKQEKRNAGGGYNMGEGIKQLKDSLAKLGSHKRRRENPKTWAAEEEKIGGERDARNLELKTPLTRVSTHTTKPVTSGGVAVDTTVGRGSDRSDHQSKTGRKEQFISTDNAEKWKSWLDKNNGIETSHKEGEKKEEWDGKFSSSTIRDDAENDDDKAVSEEESLEELTDGKLEEIEKLKSWEVFLKAINATGGLVQNDREIPVAGEKKPAIHNSGSNLKNSKIATHGQGVEAKDSQRNAITGKLPTDKGTLGNPHTETPFKPTSRVGSTTATIGGGRLGGDSRGGGKKGEANVTYSPSEVTATGTHRVTETGTREVLQHEQDRQDAVADGWDPDTGLKHQPPTKDQKDQHELTPISRAWEGWLEKKTTTEPNVGVHQEQPYAEARTAKEIEEAAQQAASTGNVDIGKLTPDMKKKKSWNEWLEKMQGAGDARFGNQHLTGMEQHPVADDDSLELSPETEENNEKDDKKEDKEEEDNKPYKALR